MTPSCRHPMAFENFSLTSPQRPDAVSRWSAGVLTGYEIHFTAITRDINSGNHFHFEWTMGKKLTDLIVRRSDCFENRDMNYPAASCGVTEKR
jgi:hypothetical protein